MMSVPIPATTLNLFILCYFLHVCTVHLLHFNAEIFSVLIFFLLIRNIYFLHLNRLQYDITLK